jgi:hypothetical protein
LNSKHDHLMSDFWATADAVASVVGNQVPTR